jgi:hypothetical protein
MSSATTTSGDVGGGSSMMSVQVANSRNLTVNSLLLISSIVVLAIMEK